MPIYKHGKSKHDRTVPRWVYGIFFVAIIAGVAYFLTTLGNGPSVDNSKNLGESTSITNNEKVGLVVTDDAFTLRLLSGWDEIEARSQYIYRSFQSVKDKRTARYIDIYKNGLPPLDDTAVTMLLPITPQPDGSLNLGKISSHCRNFTETNSNLATPEPTASLWENVDFTCLFIKGWTKVGTGSAKDGILTTVKGKTTSNKYFIVYEDKETYPDTKIFEKIMRTFKAK